MQHRIKEKSYPTPLERMKQLLEGDLKQMDAEIAAMVESYSVLIPEVALHTLQAGGKRIRPLLTLAAARLCGYDGEAHIALATAVEAIHTATLLHDDVIDESVLRRGRKTANMQWGNKEAILVGDYLFAKAFTLMGKAHSLDVFSVLSEASVVISEGEVLQITPYDDIGVFEETYLKIIHAKTAELFAAACQVGAMLAPGGEVHAGALRDYGTYLGLAFQMMDDVLDYQADESVLGKDVANDAKEGKVTLPIIVAYQQANADDQAFLHSVFIEKRYNDTLLPRLLGILKAHDALSVTIKRAKEMGEKGKICLEKLPEHPLKDALGALLDFVITRDH